MDQWIRYIDWDPAHGSPIQPLELLLPWWSGYTRWLNWFLYYNWTRIIPISEYYSVEASVFFSLVVWHLISFYCSWFWLWGEQFVCTGRLCSWWNTHALFYLFYSHTCMFFIFGKKKFSRNWSCILFNLVSFF